MKKPFAPLLAAIPALWTWLAGTAPAALAAAAEAAETGAETDYLKLFAALFLALFGGISLFAPKRLWELGLTRTAKQARREPTQAELNANRIAGALFLALAVLLFLNKL